MTCCSEIKNTYKTGTSFYFSTFWRQSWASLAWTSVGSTQSTWTAETVPRTTWPRRPLRWWPAQRWTPSTRRYPGAAATFPTWWLSWRPDRHTLIRPVCCIWHCPPPFPPRGQTLSGKFRWHWRKVRAHTWPSPWTSLPPRPVKCPSLQNARTEQCYNDCRWPESE